MGPAGAAGRTVRTPGFRAHGEGETIVIPATAVAITPTIVPADASSVTVRIDLSPYPQERVYVGDIEIVQPGVAASAPAELLTTIRIPWFRSDPVA